jgi:hypothetical protein
VTLFIKIELADEGFDWQQSDPKRAALIQEAAEAAALDAAVDRTGWSGSVSSFYTNPRLEAEVRRGGQRRPESH